MTSLTANFIPDWMYAQCNKDGNDTLLIEYLVDYRNMDRALSLKYQQLTVNGKSYMKRSTARWEIFVRCKDERTIWDKLLYLKECYPVEVTEYSVF